MELNFQCQQRKFYWNTITPINFYFCIICSCFCDKPTLAECNNCHRCHVGSKAKVFTVRPFTEKSLWTPEKKLLKNRFEAWSLMWNFFLSIFVSFQIEGEDMKFVGGYEERKLQKVEFSFKNWKLLCIIIFSVLQRNRTNMRPIYQSI